MSEALTRWNELSEQEAAREILNCCGSVAWARELVKCRPIADVESLLTNSGEIWNRLTVQDWLEAFSKHPRIGERKAPDLASAQSAKWSEQEQQSVGAERGVQSALAQANLEYEQRFARVFIVCATGKTGAEMLEILRLRLRNDDATELRAAAEEQRKITNIRLKKWLSR